MNVREYAQKENVSPKTVRRWIHEGLPAEKLGTVWSISEDTPRPEKKTSHPRWLHPLEDDDPPWD